VLLEGVPGLAKTLTVRTLAETIHTTFHRIQFTPDLLPADVLGTQVFDQSRGSFTVKKGPIFANIVLADEINRAPAKVQAALLEAMQEKQVTLGGETFFLEEPFLVLATQNPIEQEGTYPLPEAQIDRFMLKLRVGYPSREEEKEIMRRMASGEPIAVQQGRRRPAGRRAVTSPTCMDADRGLHRDIARDARAGRSGMKRSLLIEFGASPRHDRAGRPRAPMRSCAARYVAPDDVRPSRLTRCAIACSRPMKLQPRK
jgi:MoxR-like ATPase